MWSVNSQLTFDSVFFIFLVLRMKSGIWKFVINRFRHVSQSLPMHSLAQQNHTFGNGAVRFENFPVHLSKYLLQMKSSNLQQEKRTSKDKYPFASDDEQNYDDSVESSD